MIVLELPWPPKELSPNARVHFRVKAAAAKQYRETAYWLTQGMALLPDDSDITLHLEYYPPDNRKRDLDNMLSASKAAIDGIADGLGVNDQRFGFSLVRKEPAAKGKVVVRVVAA